MLAAGAKSLAANGIRFRQFYNTGRCGQYLVGWDQIRARRYQRQLEMQLIKDDWGMSGRDKDVPAWKDVPESEKPLWDMRMATYPAMVDCMDQGVGRNT